MQEVVVGIIFYHGTHIVVQIIFPLVFQRLPHHIGRAEQTHGLRAGQYDVITLFQSFQIACYDCRLKHAEEVMDAIYQIQRELLSVHDILVEVSPSLHDVIPSNVRRCSRQTLHYRTGQCGAIVFLSTEVPSHPEQVLVLRKALVVTQVVVHLRHNDEERSKCQAQSQQVQQVCCNKLLENRCKVPNYCFHRLLVSPFDNLILVLVGNYLCGMLHLGTILCHYIVFNSG